MPTPRSLVPLAIVALLALGAVAWRVQLVRVGPAGPPKVLELTPAGQRPPLACDVVLPVVPVGMTRVRSGGTPLLIHFWAPWERHGRAQSAALDSLARDFVSSDLRIVLVCSDPFPSVARFVGRQRLRLPVLLDGPGQLRAQVPCPRIPFTVLIDRAGRAAILMPGEVDWLAPGSRETLRRVLVEPAPADTATARPIHA